MLGVLHSLFRGLVGIAVLVGLACALVWTLERFGVMPG